MNKKEKQNYLCNLIRKLSEKQLDHLISLIRGMLGKRKEVIGDGK